MLEIFDKDRKKLAILQNAFNIVERERFNAISNFSFALPADDPKNDFCQKFNIIRYNDGECYRILSDIEEESETTYITYNCEHVLALLIDTCITDFVQIGGLGYYTRQVLEYLLSKQHTKHWVLHECDFARQFEYGLEKENLLSSVFSVANRFTEPYQWVVNTKVYPYQLSLKHFDTEKVPSFYVRKGHNRLKLSRQSDNTYICTRLYPFGAGEGVNQITIADVNNGVKYLQSPPEYISKYGLIEKVWVDRRYTDLQSLKEAAQVMLNELQEPYVEYETQVVGDVKVGDVVQIVDFMKTYVVETETKYGDIPERTIKIANKPQDIAGSVADLADRQRIEMTYSQGATQVYAAQSANNADSATPFNMSLYIPDEMIFINSVFAKIKVSSFRAFNTNVLSGGATKTSSDGGGTSPTTSSGGATTSSSGGGQTTSSGGATTSSTTNTTNTSSGSGGGTYSSTSDGGGQTSGSSSVTTSGTATITSGSVQTEDDVTNIGKHNHGITQGLWLLGSTNNSLTPNATVQWTPSGAHNHGSHSHNINHTHQIYAHRHQFEVLNHTHTITIAGHNHTIGNHTHSVQDHTHTIGNHTHSVTIQAHTHTVDTSHTHNITPKISFFGSPTRFDLLINNKVITTFNSTDAEIDLTQYLVNADRKIPRGQWITVGVKPNDIAYVEMAYNIQGFCQSRGDRTV